MQKMDWRRTKDNLAGKSMLLAVAFANSIVLLIFLGLFIQSTPILAKKSIIDLLLSSSWHPLKGEFGFYPFIIGTLEVTAIAMMLAVPVCLLSAIYLAEYAHRRLRGSRPCGHRCHGCHPFRHLWTLGSDRDRPFGANASAMH